MPNGADGMAFSHVDQASSPEALAEEMRYMAGMAPFQSAKRKVFEALQVQPGESVLDVGCGVGQDVLALARLVGPTGRVVGVDYSATMIEQARAGVAAAAADTRIELPVELLVADAHHLPFAEATFDRVHSERVLQHVADPQELVMEMTRVLRPGGQLVLVDADWETFLLDSADLPLTRTILRHSLLESGSANPYVGRQLLRLAVTAGLVDTLVEPLPLLITEYAVEVPLLRECAERAVANGVVTQQQAAGWLDQLEHAGREGTFVCAATMFLVRGRRPAAAGG